MDFFSKIHCGKYCTQQYTEPNCFNEYMGIFISLCVGWNMFNALFLVVNRETKGIENFKYVVYPYYSCHKRKQSAFCTHTKN